jgi:hypothetical protein
MVQYYFIILFSFCSILFCYDFLFLLVVVMCKKFARSVRTIAANLYIPSTKELLYGVYTSNIAVFTQENINLK